jgi:glucose/arabinose dehydrogenase
MRRTSCFLVALAFAACSSDPVSPPHDGGTSDAPVDSPADSPKDSPVDSPIDVIEEPPPPKDAPPPFEGGIAHPCSLPGSIQFTVNGKVTVPGGSGPDLGFLKVPTGFCVHYFGTVGNPRGLRFAPGGELFVASPTTGTTGGGLGGKAAIVVLPDDDQDGVADAPVTFLPNLPSTQGLLFTGSYFYYQDDTRIMRVAYAPGDRAPSGASEMVANIQIYHSALHWPKVLDIADDGTIFVANGGDQGEGCDPAHPFHGGVLRLDGSAGGKPVAKGMRNPIGLRCARGKNLCFAIELAKDYTAGTGGREKMVPIHEGDDWGFPCCATKNLPYADIFPVPNCSGVQPETTSFRIGNTPFDVDFEPGLWPAPWTNQAFVTLHGEAGTWTGTRVVGIAMDPATGMPLPSTDVNGMSEGGMTDFVTGWDDQSLSHGRAAMNSFSPDGRLFISNDTNGQIIWVAPLDL